MIKKMNFSVLKYRGLFVWQTFFHTSSTCNKNNQLANAFIKMSEKYGQKRKTKKPYFAANVSQPDVAIKSVMQEKRRRFVRRENALNKVFMSHITDFMAYGQFSEKIVGRGIGISKVKVSPDFQFLYIMWIANEGQDDGEIQEILNSCAFPIRDQLSQLRVVGSVPRILFVKDKFKSRVAELNNLLNRADYGEDFTPVYPSLLGTDYMKLSDSDIVETIALDDLHEMPPMRNDVFRINHTEIMKKIKKIVQKSKALHRKSGSIQDNVVGEPIILGLGGTDKITSNQESDTNSEPSMTYSEYLRAQKVLKSKMKSEKSIEWEGESSENEKWERTDLEIEEEEDVDDDDDYHLDEYSDDDDDDNDERR